MGKLKRSWRLFKLSLEITNRDRELIILPVFGIIALFAIFGIVALLGIVLAGDSGFVWTILVLIGIFLIGIIFNFLRAAQMLGVRHRLEGGDPTIGSSTNEALTVLGAIVKWSLLAVSVGIALAALRAMARDRAGGAGGLAVLIATRMVGFAWEVISFLALPIVAFEHVGPFKALKRSKDLLKNTWGENLAANIGGGIIAFLFLLPGWLIAAGIGFLVPVAGVIVGIAWALCISLLMAMITAVYQTALYMYATTGSEPEDFADLNFDEMFKTRKKPKSKKTRAW